MNHLFRRLAVLALATSAAAGAVAAAATARPTHRLNDTGQTACTLGGTATSRCNGSGEDAASGRDTASVRGEDGRNGFSFRKLGAAGEPLAASATEWSCVQDRVTGLTWEVKSDDAGLHSQWQQYTNWGDGRAGDASALVAAVNAQGWCGANDWRLPTRFELESLVDYGVSAPGTAIDLDWFPRTPGGAYWSGTRSVRDAGYAWYVDFYAYSSVYSYAGVMRAYVRLVRGTPAKPPRHFEPRSAEVVDHATGLVWQRCSVGQQWDGATCVGTASLMTWEDALAHAVALRPVDGQRWRLPNVKELDSLVSPTRTAPAINRAAFPATALVGYWSSTYDSSDPYLAWRVSFDDGSVGTGFRANSWMPYEYAVRLVRNAKPSTAN